MKVRLFAAGDGISDGILGLITRYQSSQVFAVSLPLLSRSRRSAKLGLYILLFSEVWGCFYSTTCAPIPPSFFYLITFDDCIIILNWLLICRNQYDLIECTNGLLLKQFYFMHLGYRVHMHLHALRCTAYEFVVDDVVSSINISSIYYPLYANLLLFDC